MSASRTAGAGPAGGGAHASPCRPGSGASERGRARLRRQCRGSNPHAVQISIVPPTTPARRRRRATPRRRRLVLRRFDPEGHGTPLDGRRLIAPPRRRAGTPQHDGPVTATAPRHLPGRPLGRPASPAGTMRWRQRRYEREPAPPPSWTRNMQQLTTSVHNRAKRRTQTSKAQSASSLKPRVCAQRPTGVMISST